MWILQELSLSATTTVLCGNGSVRFEHLASFCNAIKYEVVERVINGWYMTNSCKRLPEVMEQWLVMRRHFRTAGISFAEAVELSSGLLCFDSRDSVYGLRAMVHWPHDMQPPEPDYNISPNGSLLGNSTDALTNEHRVGRSSRSEQGSQPHLRDLSRKPTKILARKVTRSRLLQFALESTTQIRYRRKRVRD
jgi:hypothetical protein